MSYIGRDVDNISNVEKLDNITFDGSATYALEKSSVAYTPSGANNILISIDGVVQMGNFSVSTTNIVFDWSPTSSNTCDWILHIGVGLISTPADSSVTASKLGSLAVTGAKLNTDVISAQTELAVAPADADEFMVSDGGVLKRIDYSLIKASNTPAFLVTLGSQQTSISRSTQTKITYASEVIDSDNAFDSTTNYRFTVPAGEDGKYMFIVSASAEMPSYDPQAIMTSLYVNGSQVAFHQYFANEADFQNDQPNQVPLVTIQDLSASDYVEGFINFYQGSGGTGQIEDDNGTFFQGFKLIG